MCEEIGEKPPLKPALLFDHFKAVMQTSAEFDNYLSNVYGGSHHKDKTKMAELRSDDWQNQEIETPTSKKYSTERAKRPSPFSRDRVGAAQINEQIILTPSVQKKAIVADVTETSGKDLKEEKKFKLWQKKKQKKKQEKKLRRFEIRERNMEKRQ